jgi:hypothetical protein
MDGLAGQKNADPASRIRWVEYQDIPECVENGPSANVGCETPSVRRKVVVLR